MRISRFDLAGTGVAAGFIVVVVGVEVTAVEVVVVFVGRVKRGGYSLPKHKNGHFMQ